MEIDIQIKGATPEELRDLFSRVPVAAAYKITVPEKTFPQGPEDLGACRDCTEHGDNFENCDACAPPLPEKEEPIQKSPCPATVEQKLRAIAGDGPVDKALKEAADKITEEVLPLGFPPIRPAKKKRGGSHKGNKFGIPPELFSTDKQAYQRLWSRCKKGGMMYEEALKMGDSRRKRSPKVRSSPLELVEPGYSAPAIKLNDHVRQIKKFNDRQVSGIGVVTNFVKGLIEVNFNGTQYYKIAPDCLEVV